MHVLNDNFFFTIIYIKWKKHIINTNIQLWHKLSILGVNGKMLKLKSLNERVQCTVRINAFHSE